MIGLTTRGGSHISNSSLRPKMANVMKTDVASGSKVDRDKLQPAKGKVQSAKIPDKS